MTETEACIALNMVPHLGPLRLRKLLERLESPERILKASPSELQRVDGIGPEIAASLARWQDTLDLSAELALIEQFGARVITQKDPLFPRALREIYNPPIVLYVWGTLTEHDHHAVGIVGSRKTSHYGLSCAKKLAYQIAYSGITVVSGLARGIDTAAHQGALAAKGRTLAVIGSGFLELYPPENAGLAEKIAASGAVLSEYPMKFPPSPQNFPYRNRIVAGWGSGLLVVEAGLNSGALITANQAAEHGRQVYAVPGPIDRPTSAGSNRLIQQGAKLVTSAADVLEDLENLFPSTHLVSRRSSSAESPLAATGIAHTAPRSDWAPSAEALSVWSALSDSPTPLDGIAEVTGLSVQRVLSLLLDLEMRRRVKQLPGKHFVKAPQSLLS
jgi:DNA processing protein